MRPSQPVRHLIVRRNAGRCSSARRAWEGLPLRGITTVAHAQIVQVVLDAFLAVAAVGGDGARRAPGALGDPFHRRRQLRRVGRVAHLDGVVEHDPVVVVGDLGLVGTVTLIEICSGAVDCGAMAMDQRWGVGISGGNVERGNLTPDREALIYFGSPLGRAEPMPSWSKVRGDGAKGRR